MMIEDEQDYKREPRFGKNEWNAVKMRKKLMKKSILKISISRLNLIAIQDRLSLSKRLNNSPRKASIQLSYYYPFKSESRQHGIIIETIISTKSSNNHNDGY